MTEPGRDGVVIVPRPSGLPPLDPRSTTWPFGDVGECLVQVNGLPQLMPVDCGEPHDLQRVAVGEVDDGRIAVTGFAAGEVGATTETECRRVLGHVDGDTSDGSTLSVAVTRPSATTWASGDRRYQCLVGAKGRHVVGTVMADRPSR